MYFSCMAKVSPLGAGESAAIRVEIAGAWPRPASVPVQQTSLPRYDSHTSTAVDLDLLAMEPSDVPARVRAWCEGALAGQRLTLRGPEAAVQRAASEARRWGAVEEELVLIVTDVSEGDVEGVRLRRIHCGGCHQITRLSAQIGDAFRCSACRALLVVHHHFSGLRGAFLGMPIGLPE